MKKLLWFLYLLVVGLNFADMFTTRIAVPMGMMEANPFASGMVMADDVMGMFLAKAAFCVIMGIWAWYSYRTNNSLLAALGLTFMVGSFFAITVTNAMGIYTLWSWGIPLPF